MPLIIKELIAHVETPQANQQSPETASGAKENEQKVLDQLSITEEREQRLIHD